MAENCINDWEELEKEYDELEVKLQSSLGNVLLICGAVAVGTGVIGD